MAFVNHIRKDQPEPIGVTVRRHKMTPLVLIHLNQLYAVNLQPTLSLPVKHSCAMTACPEYSMRVACCRGSREQERERARQTQTERDVPLKPNPIFYL